MTAYMIIESTVRDPVVYDQYLVQVPATLAKFGGRYLARGGRITPLSPAWNPGRIILLEFPAEESIRAWLASAEYGAIAPLREAGADTRAVIVEGCGDEPAPLSVTRR